MPRSEAINEFLEQCFSLETYGIDPYVIKVGKNPMDVVIGASSSKVLVFVLNQIIYDIPWEYIAEIDYSGKYLKLRFKREYFSTYLVENPHLSPDVTLSKIVGPPDLMDELKPQTSDTKIQVTFTCPNKTFAKNLWRHLLSQQIFFKEESAKLVKPRFSKPKIPFLTRGSTFRCPTNRVMREIQKDSTPARQEQNEFVRYSLPRKQPRSESGSDKGATCHSVPSITIDAPSIHPDENEEHLANELHVALTNQITPDVIQSSTPERGFNQINVDRTQSSDETTFPEYHHSNDLTNSITNGTAIQDHPITENISSANGKSVNGTASSAKLEQPVQADTSKSVSRQLVMGMLDLLVIILLFSIVVIAIFETAGPNDPDWFNPYISNFRYNHYNPLRASLIRHYQQLFH